MKDKFYVYHLIDPRTGTPFYVGKGQGNRLFQHIHDVINGRIPNGNNYLFNKIRKILSLGLKIECKKIIEHISEQQSFLIEKAEIQKHGMRGKGILCNLSLGGEGNGGYKHTLEQIEKHRQSLKKRFSDPVFLAEHRKRMKQIHSTPEAKKKNSQRIKQFYQNNPLQIKKLSTIQKKLWRDGKYNNSKSWVFMSPDGEKTEFENLQQFCKENHLCQSNMIAVFRGRRNQHKGWRQCIIS